MSNIPAKYSYLSTVGVLPKVISYALTLLGTKEVIGPKSNPVIMQWAKTLNDNGCRIAGYADDSVPWCGLFAAFVVYSSGKVPIPNPLWALNWQGFGTEVAHNVGSTATPKLSFADGLKASLGDVLVFQRKTATGFAGHVGFYVGEDTEAYHVLGGNQGDAVSIVRVLKARCVAVRRPPMTTPPASLKPYILAADGALSHNEG